MNKSTISLCMIVKDEERCIERCLESVYSTVDEIIVVDTGSSDRTLELIAKFNAKVFHYKWDHNFSNARNHAIEQATGDYILQLDADEWLEDSEHDLSSALDKDIYYLPIRNDLGGGLAEVHKFPRLFRNINELRYEGALHEQINLTLNWHRSSAVLENIVIHHDGYLMPVVNLKNKKKRNMDILLQENKDNPSAFNYYNLGQQYFTEGEYQKALEAYRKSYQYGGEYTFTKRLYLGLIQALMQLKQYQDALSIASDCFSLYPDYVEFKYYEGLTYQELGYLQDAADCFETCIKIGDSNPAIHFNTYEGTGSYLAFARLSEIAVERFDQKRANEYIVQAILKAPNVMGMLKSFLEINYHADRSTLFEKMSILWPNQKSVIQQLITALYHLRHPVLLEYINRYEVQTDQGVEAFVNILKGEYQSAREYYHFSENKHNDIREILLISFLLSDTNLLEHYFDSVSLRSNEQKILKSIISKETFTCLEFTKEFVEIIYNLLIDVLKLQDYRYMDYFTEQFNNPQMRYVLAKACYKAGFYDISLSVLLEGTTEKESYKINLLAAKALRQLGSLEDSIYYYNQAVEIKKSAMIAFHICDVALELNDLVSLENILNDISNLQPESKWVKSLSLSRFTL
ncbi:glycosyltransferase [Paenibacillus sp. FSL W7-1279]|uniref:glycosyltransferase n=1 Tax=Paenibacillus sp. FSL W7-1279 TaxID=2921697 RepID=UPI0030DC0A9D